MDLKKYKKIFLLGFILTNLGAATAVSVALVLNNNNNNNNNNFFSISDTKKITDLNKLLWLNNPYWHDILKKQPQKLDLLIQKYPLFEDYLFDDSDDNIALIQLSGFFYSESAKNEDTMEFNVIWDQRQLKDKKIADNFVVLDNKNDFLSFISKLKIEKLSKRILSTPDFFEKKSVIIYIRPQDIADGSSFNSKSKMSSLNPNHIFQNNQNDGKTSIISFDSKFKNFFHSRIEYRYTGPQRARTPKVITGIKKPRVIVPRVSLRPNTTITDFDIFYKIIDKSSKHVFDRNLDIHIKKIEDLVLYNKIIRHKESNEFKKFLLKKQEIFSKNPFQLTRLYAMQELNPSNKGTEEDQIFSTLEQTKKFISDHSQLKNWDWGDAFHPSNLFISKDNNSEEFNKFILKKQDPKIIFDDQILYWKIDKDIIKIYTFNYKDLFPNFAVEPDNFVIKDLQKFEKIDIGNTDIKKIEYIKIKTLEEFNSLHNQITTA
ncbi:hypothetical protein [Mesomycoplasma ovipneumoniae]|uniref:hypothetical protein n=1 Tax=Mesomycoplasma ovipneumoniae TaxID=29562 RepID=UPI002963ED23|nr:hypothetical protein [Mesomycoplasma ovipneumoniae]MDW2910319.1 hypothetical protein [Mesomycoplasma ovipneumoniae]MDW2917572.1 hypothetical protein [Mesomycoplasma ovipneumoniae]